MRLLAPYKLPAMEARLARRSSRNWCALWLYARFMHVNYSRFRHWPGRFV